MAPTSDPRQRHAELCAEIRRHDGLYYAGRPEIADADYDRLFRELGQLEAAHPALVRPDSPTQRVGPPLPEGQGLAQVRHGVPMLSIDSLFSEEEVRDFEARVRRFLNLEEGSALDWSVEPKFDGVSVSLRWESGRFARAVTRGDGSLGEDVTQNLRTVRNLPLELSGAELAPPRAIEVRGEVLIEREAFAAFNRRRTEQGLPLLANPRNATAGAVRRNDPSEVARYPLRFLAWGVVGLDGPTFRTWSETVAALAAWGLPLSPERKLCRGLDQALEYHDQLEARRFEIPYDIDGVVAKLDRLDLRDRLGSTSRSVRWQYAHKFAPVEALSLLRAMEVQVGTNGRLTPRAHLDPVEVGGVTVRHTTLHNEGYVTALGLRPGDRVFLQRAGDVIPQITGVAEPAAAEAPADWAERIPEELLLPAAAPAASGHGPPGATGRSGAPHIRPGVIWRHGETFAMPASCPACGTPSQAVGRYWFCPNGLSCPPQLVGRLQQLAGRNGFDIDQLGEKRIEQLIEHGFVRELADLFHLRPEPLLAIERWGEKSVAKLFEQLEQRRAIPFDRFLVALGIPEVGPATGRLLAQHYSSWDELAAASEEELQHVDGIGPEMAQGIRAWSAEPRNLELVRRLLAGGVRVLPLAPPRGEGPLAGRTLVLTGTLAGLSRAEAKKLIEDLGGKVASSVSARTDFLVAGADSGSKRKRAEELGVRVLDEAEFLRLAGRENVPGGGGGGD